MKNKFIPAARFSILTPFFDFLLNITGLGSKYRRWVRKQFVDELKIGSKVLDAGSGTGTIAIELKGLKPNIDLSAVDIDSSIIEISKKKAIKAKQVIKWITASLTKLPFEDKSFDLAYSSLVTHHLNKNQKLLAFNELYRVLKPGSALYVCDIGESKYSLVPIASWFAAIFEEGKENYDGQIPQMLKDAGFSKVEYLSHYRFNVICIKATK